MKNEFTIGTDPEFFLHDGEKFISAIPFVHGAKDNPEMLRCGGTVQRDNVAVEFATPPARSLSAFQSAINECMQNVKELLPYDLEMVAVPSAIFDDSELFDDEAWEFGCDPDFNAWEEGGQNCKPSAKDTHLRSCGGHVHVGSKELETTDKKLLMIKLMDATLGVVSTVIDSSPEAIRRRTLYGKAGAFRPTEYGVEYRSLSNFWLGSPHYIEMVYRLVDECLELVKTGVGQDLLDDLNQEDLLNTINNGNVKQALDIWETVLVPWLDESTVWCVEQAFMNESRKEVAV